MEKRLILALVLSVLVLIFWQRLSSRMLPGTRTADDRTKASQSAGAVPKEPSAALPDSPAGEVSTSLSVPDEPMLWLETSNLKLGVGQQTGAIRHALVKGYQKIFVGILLWSTLPIWAKECLLLRYSRTRPKAGSNG